MGKLQRESKVVIPLSIVFPYKMSHSVYSIDSQLKRKCVRLTSADYLEYFAELFCTGCASENGKLF